MRAIRILFAISDFCAWLVMTVAVVAGVAAPIVIPIQARMAHRETDALATATTVGLCLTVALGAFLVARRRIVGLPLLLVPAGFLAFDGEFVAAVVVILAVLLVFGLPHWWVMRHASRSETP